ncbi:MAG: GTPase Era [Bradymonadia bacterium]
MVENQGQTKCGFVTLVGRPNVGKSTLLNALLGSKLAITSAKPQTTRNRIPGILTEGDHQIILIDTPGIHAAKGALNSFMVDQAKDALWETDVIALMVEAGISSDGAVGAPQAVVDLLESLSATNKPIVLVLNKVDKIEKSLLLPIMDAWRSRFEFAAIVPVSALKRDGVDQFLSLVTSLLPEGPHLYPSDSLTDLPERFIAAEIVREQIFRLLEQELPYSTAVVVEAWKDRSSQGVIDIQALIVVERDSQKGIVIGRQGQMIKKIGIQARKSLERFLGVQVNLKLFVKVDKGWTKSTRRMNDLGYGS